MTDNLKSMRLETDPAVTQFAKRHETVYRGPKKGLYTFIGTHLIGVGEARPCPGCILCGNSGVIARVLKEGQLGGR